MTTRFGQHVRHGLAAIGVATLLAWAAIPAFAAEESTMTEQKKQATELLKSIETGDPRPLTFINPDK
jgi:hypothetical protein